MGVVARILILLTVVLTLANAQCLTVCSIQPCSQANGHCHQDPEQKASPACSHAHVIGSPEVRTHLIPSGPTQVVDFTTIARVTDAPSIHVDAANVSPPRDLLTTLRI